MEPSKDRRVRLPKAPGRERRASDRFPVPLEISYSASPHDVPPETGSGRIINLSSSGLRFTAERPRLAGLRLDVSIDWPVRLDGGVQLQLIASGVVAWTSGTETALRIQRHEFKTRRIGIGRLKRSGNAVCQADLS